jgi:hypothetical protein
MLAALTMIMLFQPSAFGQYYYTHHTTLILRPISHTIQQGYRLDFSGTLLTSDDKKPLPNRTIYIQYDSPYDWTRTLTSATTDNNGNFDVIWTARPKGSSACTYNLFAKFNGDDNYYWTVSKQFELYVTTSSVKN